MTGGTGFIGGNLLERLVSEGREVVALARSSPAAATLRDRRVTPAPGDLADEEALVEGMRGCEVLYHAAGINALCLCDPSPLYRTNVDGARRVVRAGARAGIRRIVLTSSAATIGEGRGCVGAENSPHRGWFLSHYERSKHEGERAAFESAAAAGVELVSVNPASVQGPGRTGGPARLILDYLNGKLPVFVDATLSLVDVSDCIEGHLLAEARGRPGERYLLSGATLSTGEALALLSRLSGVRRRVRRLPPGAALAVGTLAEAAGRLLGKRPVICRETMRTVLHGHAYDGSKATRELGLRYRSAEDTFRRALLWYAEHGCVPDGLPGLQSRPD
ncbi:MAG: NAD-dependent epimerase/dehydratase family protein [Actinomycetota bacterium]